MSRAGGGARAHRIRNLAVASAAGFALACAAATATPGPEPHPALRRLWRDYQTLPAARALYLAGDPARVLWVAGLAGGHAEQGEAERSALAECRRKRAARRMQSPCRLYARGDEIVWPLR